MADESTIQTEEQLQEVAEEEAPQEPEVELPATPLFGKWDATDIEVRDAGLARYINLESVGLPHHSSRHANKRFGKVHTPLVERLINNVMRSGAYTGKKAKAFSIVEQAFDRVSEKTKENPLQAFVRAVENAAPREEVTRLRYGGINVPKAVDVAPQRRLDMALRNIAKGGLSGSHKSKKPAWQCLADEIIKAADNDPSSFSVGKKDETERIAKSAR